MRRSVWIRKARVAWQMTREVVPMVELPWLVVVIVY